MFGGSGRLYSESGSSYKSCPSCSISSTRKSMSDLVAAGLEMTIRKKLTLFPCGWYPTIVVPDSIIMALIFGATCCGKTWRYHPNSTNVLTCTTLLLRQFLNSSGGANGCECRFAHFPELFLPAAL